MFPNPFNKPPGQFSMPLNLFTVPRSPVHHTAGSSDDERLHKKLKRKKDTTKTATIEVGMDQSSMVPSGNETAGIKIPSLKYVKLC
jgi:hypothetical protein